MLIILDSMSKMDGNTISYVTLSIRLPSLHLSGSIPDSILSLSFSAAAAATTTSFSLSHLSLPSASDLCSLGCRACGESRQSPRPRTPPDKVTEVCQSEIKTAPSIQRVPPLGSHYHSRSPCQKSSNGYVVHRR